VSVRIEFSPAQVQMTINDIGDGFHVLEVVDDYVSSRKLGLAGMDERARSVGGTLAIRSQRDHGTVVSIAIPIGPGPRDTAYAEQSQWDTLQCQSDGLKRLECA